MFFCVFRRTASLSLVLAVLLLTLFVASAQAASQDPHTWATAVQKAPVTQGASQPTRISTSTAPHLKQGILPVVPSVQAAPASSHVQPAPSSGAVIVKPPARVKTGIGVKPATVTASPSFTGLSYALATPQDPTADDGPYNVIEVASSEFAIYSRSGSLQYSNSFAGWFGDNTSFDGNVALDPWNERFVFMANDRYNVSFAVAQQANALGSYCNYTFAVPGLSNSPGSNFLENTAIGYDETYLYFTASEVANNGIFLFSILYQINLTQMASCGSTSFWTWDHLTDPNGNQAFGIVPAMKYDYNPAQDQEYLVDAVSGGGCSITLCRLNIHSLSSNSLNSQCYSPPPAAPQYGAPSGMTISTASFASGNTFIHQATYRANLLDFALTTAYNWGSGPITSAAEWFKLNPGTLSVYQQGILGGPNYWYFYPAMVQGLNSKTVIVFSVSSAFLYPSVWYLGQNTDGSSQDTQVLAWGSAFTSNYFYGYYQSARSDSVDGLHAWICGLYSEADNVWGTQIAETEAS